MNQVCAGFSQNDCGLYYLDCAYNTSSKTCNNIACEQLFGEEDCVAKYCKTLTYTTTYNSTQFVCYNGLRIRILGLFCFTLPSGTAPPCGSLDSETLCAEFGCSFFKEAGTCTSWNTPLQLASASIACFRWCPSLPKSER